jgi:hypothetical protein
VPEWPNGLDSKSSVRVTVPWVRIPPSPPAIYLFAIKYILSILNQEYRHICRQLRRPSSAAARRKLLRRPPLANFAQKSLFRILAVPLAHCSGERGPRAWNPGSTPGHSRSACAASRRKIPAQGRRSRLTTPPAGMRRRRRKLQDRSRACATGHGVRAPRHVDRGEGVGSSTKKAHVEQPPRRAAPAKWRSTRCAVKTRYGVTNRRADSSFRRCRSFAICASHADSWSVDHSAFSVSTGSMLAARRAGM